MIIANNNYSVIELKQMLERRDVLVNKDYQRGSSIWPPGPSSYFIDTILENFPFPKIYMYEFIDHENRGVKKEIVDGQQRIGTIIRFLDNEFAITGESKFAGKKFDDLDEDTANSFLSYSISVDIIRNASRSEILQMFRRMNAYTLPLNEAEKRHSSYQGKFKWSVNDLASALNEFFLEFRVFTSRQIVRMADAALIADLVLALQKGIVSSSPKELNRIYKLYDEDLGLSEEHLDQIATTVAFITEHLQDLRGGFMMKPYAFHSLVTALIHNRFGIAEITNELGIPPTGDYVSDPMTANRNLTALALAHEAKEIEGPYSQYVWGTASTTDRKLRRTARIVSILEAIGVPIPDGVEVDQS